MYKIHSLTSRFVYKVFVAVSVQRLKNCHIYSTIKTNEEVLGKEGCRVLRAYFGTEALYLLSQKKTDLDRKNNV